MSRAARLGSVVDHPVVRRLGSFRTHSFGPLKSVSPGASQSRDSPPYTFSNGIVISRSPSKTNPSDLITHIDAQRSKHANGAKHPFNFALLFLTPSFTSWLQDSETFVEKVVRRAFKNAESEKTITVVAAVVDKLPAPHTVGNSAEDASKIIEEGRLRAEVPPIHDPGFEGMAYALLRDDCVVSLKQNVCSNLTGSITFLQSHNSVFESTNTEDEDVLRSIRLPLANTLFQNGSATTMVRSKWNKVKSTRFGQEGKFIRQEWSKISHFSLRIGPPKNSDDPCLAVSTMAIPLIPLTTPRTIVAGMGNIVRLVSADGQDMPASKDLENAVPQYFQARDEPASALPVWALTIPESWSTTMTERTRECLAQAQSAGEVGLSKAERKYVSGTGDMVNQDQWRELWKSSPPLWSKMVPEAITNGARLYKVLSGGGGWGKKAGLLSLDPSIAYNDSISPPQLPAFELADSSEHLSSTNCQIVKPGDAIQFFTTPPIQTPALVDLVSDSSDPKSPRHGICHHPRWIWEFGTLPSSIDGAPGNPWQQFISKRLETITAYKGCFGALTESDITFRQFKIHEDKVDAMPYCKIDVPCSRFSAVDEKSLHHVTQIKDVVIRHVKQPPPCQTLIRFLMSKNAINAHDTVQGNEQINRAYNDTAKHEEQPVCSSSIPSLRKVGSKKDPNNQYGPRQEILTTTT